MSVIVLHSADSSTFLSAITPNVLVEDVLWEGGGTKTQILVYHYLLHGSVQLVTH